MRVGGEGQPPGILQRRLATRGELSSRGERIVLGVERSPRTLIPAKRPICLFGQTMPNPLCVMSGWAARTLYLPDGRRQIVSLLLPGDLLGATLRGGWVASCDVTALTAVSVADASDLQQAWREPERCGRLADALDDCAAAEERRAYDQIVRLGRMTALERVAHLCLELEARLVKRDLVRGVTFDVPLTQEVLSDFLGLSLVHMNRTIQQMRLMKLVRFGRGVLEIVSRGELVRISGYRTATQHS